MGKKALISLMGFMGAGKSVIARSISEKLSIPLYDLDSQIEAGEGESISMIFEKYGDFHFRKVERSYLKDTLSRKEGIIALGGGAPCYFDNIKLINQNSTSYYIDVPSLELTLRLEKDNGNRPILENKTGDELIKHIDVLLANRLQYYNQANHHIKKLDFDEICMEIVKRYL